MQIWFKMGLTQSHLRTSFQIFFYRLSFSFNRAETSSFAHLVYITCNFFQLHVSTAILILSVADKFEQTFCCGASNAIFVEFFIIGCEAIAIPRERQILQT
jgi:hypothetical protein